MGSEFNLYLEVTQEMPAIHSQLILKFPVKITAFISSWTTWWRADPPGRAASGKVRIVER